MLSPVNIESNPPIYYEYNRQVCGGYTSLPVIETTGFKKGTDENNFILSLSDEGNGTVLLDTTDVLYSIDFSNVEDFFFHIPLHVSTEAEGGLGFIVATLRIHKDEGDYIYSNSLFTPLMQGFADVNLKVGLKDMSLIKAALKKSNQLKSSLELRVINTLPENASAVLEVRNVFNVYCPFPELPRLPAGYHYAMYETDDSKIYILNDRGQKISWVQY